MEKVIPKNGFLTIKITSPEFIVKLDRSMPEQVIDLVSYRVQCKDVATALALQDIWIDLPFLSNNLVDNFDTTNICLPLDDLQVNIWQGLNREFTTDGIVPKQFTARIMKSDGTLVTTGDVVAVTLIFQTQMIYA